MPLSAKLWDSGFHPSLWDIQGRWGGGDCDLGGTFHSTLPLHYGSPPWIVSFNISSFRSASWSSHVQVLSDTCCLQSSICLFMFLILPPKTYHAQQLERHTKACSHHLPNERDKDMYDYYNSSHPRLDVWSQWCAWNKPYMKSQHFILHGLLLGVLLHLEIARGNWLRPHCLPRGGGRVCLLLTSWLSLWVNMPVPLSSIQPCEVGIIINVRAEIASQSYTQNFCFCFSIRSGMETSYMGLGWVISDWWLDLQLLLPLQAVLIPSFSGLFSTPSVWYGYKLSYKMFIIEVLISSWWHYSAVTGS